MSWIYIRLGQNIFSLSNEMYLIRPYFYPDVLIELFNPDFFIVNEIIKKKLYSMIILIFSPPDQIQV
jgi:hypothetical protein